MKDRTVKYDLKKKVDLGFNIGDKKYCKLCNEPFIRRTWNQVYCSHGCRFKAERLPNIKETFRLSKEDQVLRLKIIEDK